MDVQEAILKRQSIRRFKNIPIEKSVIENLLMLAHQAPSAGNTQARDFILIDDPKIKEQLRPLAHNQRVLTEAPLVIAVCANLDRIQPYGQRGKNLYCLQDTAAAIDHFLLLATEAGFATCWVGAFNEQHVHELLQLPENSRPVALIPIGYANEKPKKTDRIELKELLHYNTW